jgi:hypothetical protein
MDRLGLNLDGMAAQLEISLRQVAAFRGSKPIPNHMALAIRHLDQHGGGPNPGCAEARLSCNLMGRA